MVSLCATFAIIPSFAEGRTFLADEFDAAAEGFDIAVTDARGLNAGVFSPSLTEDEVYGLYSKDYNDEYGSHNLDGSVAEEGYSYRIDDPAPLLTDSVDMTFGGYWSTPVSSPLPMNQMPLNIDIDLNGVKTVSGVRLYGRTNGEEDGAVLRYKVYAKFEGDSEFTYLYSDGNRSNTAKDVETAFGQNLAITALRVQITAVKTQTYAGKVSKFDERAYCYFIISGVTVLKGYNEGGATYASTPGTATSASELDELSVIATNARFAGDGWSADMSMRGMDDDLSSTISTNGNLTLDFGKNVTFSGFRYYPPKSYNNEGRNFPGITKIGDFFTLSKSMALTAEGRADLSGSGASEMGKTAEMNAFPYPTGTDGNTDYTKPVTISFGSNVTAHGIVINSWFEVGGSAGYGGVGEIKLLAPIDGTNGYKTEDIINLDTVPSVTDFAATSGKGATGKAGALFDNVVHVDDADPNNGSFFYGCDHANFPEGNKVTLTIDLGREYEFSAVRLFGRLSQPDQAMIEGNLYISSDGNLWSGALVHKDAKAGVINIGGASNHGMIKYQSTNDIYTDMKANLADGQVNMSARYLRIEVTKTSGNHFSAQELMLVEADASLGEAKTAEDFKADKIVEWGEPLPTVTEAFAGSDKPSHDKNGAVLFDGEHSSGAEGKQYGWEAGNYNNGFPAYFIVDLGAEYEFSAVRLYGRHGFLKRALRNGNISFSSDGTAWSPKSMHTDTIDETGYGKSYISTGKDYTDMLVKLGSEQYNAKARYIRVECTKSPAWPQWVMEELQLVEADASLGEAKTVEDLDGPVVLWETTPAVTDSYSQNGAGLTSSNHASLFDGVVVSEGVSKYNNAPGYGWDNCKINQGNNTAFVTIDLGQEYEFSAVRVYGRYDIWFQSMTEGNLLISSDTRNSDSNSSVRISAMWSRPMPHKDKVTATPAVANGAGNPIYSSSGDMYTDMKAPDGSNMRARYIRIQATESAAYEGGWWMQEIQLVKPVEGNETKSYTDEGFAAYSHGYYSEEKNVLLWDESADAPKVIDRGQSGTAGALKGNAAALFDRIIYLSRAEHNENDYSALLINDFGLKDGNSVYFSVDLGKEYEFSGIRLFGRWKNVGNAPNDCTVYYSDDGENWSVPVYCTDEYDGTVGSDMIKYKSTGDVFTDLKATVEGKTYNMKARYVKIEITRAGSEHPALQELMLVKPVSGNDTLTATGLNSLFGEKAAAVDALIEAIGEVTKTSGPAIKAARTAYDALDAYSKTLVTKLDVLQAAEIAFQTFEVSNIIEAIDALPELTDLSYTDGEAIDEVYAEYDALSDENKAKVTNSAKLISLKANIAGLTFTINMASKNDNWAGRKDAKFTIPGEKKITKIIYKDTEYTEADGWFIQSAADGKTTLTLQGSYAANNFPTWGQDTVGKALAEGKTVTAPNDIPAIGMKAGDKFTPGTGKLTHIICEDDPMAGNHIITVEYEDGTTKNVNLITTGVVFANMSNPGSTGAADEITPTNEWRWASASGGALDRAFTGKHGNQNDWQHYFETDYIASKINIDGTEIANNVVWCVPLPHTLYVDLKGNTEAYSGVRFYNRSTSAGGTNVGTVDVWGKMEETDEWTKIGNYNLSSKSAPLDLIFNEDHSTVNYRFLMFTVTRYWGGATASNLNIGNISIVRPYVTINGSDSFTTDIDDEFVTDVPFSFFMAEAESVASVTKGGTDIGAANWSFENDTITIKADYVKTLPEGTTELKVTFNNGNVVPVKITRADIKTVTYYVIGNKSDGYDRGTNNLVLNAVGGKKATKLTINGKSVAFTQLGTEITVKRYNFRGIDIWENYKNDGYVMATAEFEGGMTVDYKIILKGIVYKASTVSVSGYKSDEIPAKSGWTVEVDSSEFAGNIANIFTNSGENNWHSGYSVENGSVVIADSKLPHYVEFDLGESTEFSGIRYYRRTDGNNTAGMWSSVGIYGKENADDEWALIKPMGKITYNDNAATVADIKLDVTAKTRYVRLVVSGSGYHATAKWIRFLKATTPFKGAEMANTVVPMDYDLGENAVAKVTLNGAGKITSLTHQTVELPAEYVTITDDTASISPYYFKDNAYGIGDEVPFKLTFAFGPAIDFKVKVGEVDGYKIDLRTGEHGTLKATAYNAELDREEDKASGTKVRNTDSLTFTAIADEGYEVESWYVRSTTPVYELIPDSEKSKWGITASSSNSHNGPGNMIDGNADSATNYWHSGYTVTEDENGKQIVTPDPNKPYTIELDFSNTPEGCIVNASGFSFIPRTGAGVTVKDYTFYAKLVGSDEWTEIAKGTLPRNNNKHDIKFDRVCSITNLKFEMTTLYDNYAYISEIYMYREKMPSGTVVRRGTASEDFVINDRFTDMEVTATFKKMAEGTVSVSTDLKNIVTKAPVSAPKGSDLTVELTPAEGYYVSEASQVTVTLDGAILKAGVDYIYDRQSDEAATLTIKNITGKNLVIKASAKDYLNHKVSYVDVFGATGSLPRSKDVVEGHEFTVSKSTLKLVGYVFAGWSYNGKTYKAGDTLTMGDEDIVFSAVWTKDDSKEDESGKTDKPSGGGGGGSSKPSSGGSGGIGGGSDTTYTVIVNGVTTKVMTGAVIAAPEAPAGYTFKGYYLDEALTVPYANDGVKANITLYPAFEKNRARTDLTDIAGHWAEEYIASLYEKSIVSGSGDGKFNPDSNITRAEFIQILYNMSNMTSDGSQSFKDVKAGDWFSQAVAWAVNFGITSGTSEDTFSPYEKITREQMAAMIYRYATLMGADWQTSETGEFADEGEIAEYAKYQVRWAKGAGIISGRPDGSFGPKDNATRAESAAMLSRLVK